MNNVYIKLTKTTLILCSHNHMFPIWSVDENDWGETKKTSIVMAKLQLVTYKCKYKWLMRPKKGIKK